MKLYCRMIAMEMLHRKLELQ